jgi:hypothetical protein
VSTCECFDQIYPWPHSLPLHPGRLGLKNLHEDLPDTAHPQHFDLVAPYAPPKAVSSRKLFVQLLLQLLLRWLKLLGRLLLLNSTVLVPILMHTVRTLITEAFMKALKVIPIKSGSYLLTAINVLVRGQVRRANTDTGKVTLRFHVL